MLAQKATGGGEMEVGEKISDQLWPRLFSVSEEAFLSLYHPAGSQPEPWHISPLNVCKMELW